MPCHDKQHDSPRAWQETRGSAICGLFKKTSCTVSVRRLVCDGVDAMQASRLVVSTGQVALRGGRSMRQLSLTDYFEALHRLTCDAGQTVDGGSAVFFPVRRFNPEALVLEDGSSLFERLCAIADLVVVEDVDLAPPLLVRHLEYHHLGGLAASDATDGRRTHSGHLLCVARCNLALCLPGRRLW